ncbi:hypothetical protein ACMU_11905 [Actibacterium mucosum KCTC 23349]|uniref:Gamma-glutamyl kinase n=2 Tax=Actibacterium TaxID=1433986 RepID=A0A037ZH13_9RHOB|nr:hypothetical protein ACMU_11905 [Actibacterium mucosum KCTC 23349]
MLVFWKAGLVLLAVPKTGTQAYEAMLAEEADVVLRHPPGLKHMPAQKFTRKFLPLLGPDAVDRLESAAVIREPLDWLGSWFRYRSRPQLDGHPNSTAGQSFDAFVDAYLEDEPPAFARVGAQARFVSNAQGKVIVDHLFAFEKPVAFRAFLSERLGKNTPEPPPRNVSPTRKLVLSSELEARLRQKHAADFALHEKLVQ